MLEEDKVKFVFGPFLTNVFKGIEPYAKQHDGKFLLMGGATAIHYDLGKPGNDYLMRTWNWDAGPSGFGTLMVDYLKKTRREEGRDADAERRVRPRRRATSTGTLFKGAGIEFEENWFEPGTKDYSAVLAKIAAGKPDYLFPGYTDAVLYDIVQQATAARHHEVLARARLARARRSRTRTTSTTTSSTSRSTSRRRRRPSRRSASSSPPTRPSTRRDFPYDQAPLCSSSCYDHVFMLVEAMKKAGTVDDVAKVQAALLSFTYDGLWKIRFDKTGEEVFNFDIVDVQEGRQDRRDARRAEVDCSAASVARRMLQLVVGQLLNGIIVGTLYAIIALGVTLTFGITGIVNFALGAFMMIGAYVTWYLTDGVGICPIRSPVPLAVVSIALFGLVVDQALFRFTRNNLINGLIVSIGLISVIDRGAC